MMIGTMIAAILSFAIAMAIIMGCAALIYGIVWFFTRPAVLAICGIILAVWFLASRQ